MEPSRRLLPISVVICSHNPRPAVLREVLEALEAQTCAQADWELLLIDNASASPLQGSFDLSWHAAARHVREEELGLTAARLRGIAESRGEVLVFVDDDNVLEPDYLSRTLDVAARWPMLGAWGGAAIPRYETPPPDRLLPFTKWMALRDVDEDRWGNLRYVDEITPWGAGMCIRTQVARRYRENVLTDRRRRLLGRKGASLASAEDRDMAYTAIDLGLGVGLFKDLRLVHVIPTSRVSERHLLGLVEGDAYSQRWLRELREGPLPDRRRLVQRVASILGRSFLGRRLRFERMQRLFFEAHLRGEARAEREIRILRYEYDRARDDSARAVGDSPT